MVRQLVFTSCSDNRSISKHFIINHNSILRLKLLGRGRKARMLLLVPWPLETRPLLQHALSLNRGGQRCLDMLSQAMAPRCNRNMSVANCCKHFATSFQKGKKKTFPPWPCFPAASVLVLQRSRFVCLSSPAF